MARATWSGFLNFGLVSLPVGLYSATRDQTVHFNQLHKGTSHRVRYKKVDEVTGEELTSADIVNGFPISEDEYVVISRDDLKNAMPGKSEVIEITDFVNLDEIDPMFFRQTYYLAPRGKGADRAYALLRQTMREANKVGVATLVLRDKEYLVAVRPGDEILMLETMYFADEIRDPRKELDELPNLEAANDRELSIAKQLVDSLTTSWTPESYKNTYRERVEELIEQKRNGHAVAVRTESPKSNVIDLMAALQASVEQTRQTRSDSDTPKAPAKAAKRGAKAAAENEQQSFDGMSKAELLDRAAKIEIPGRTKMTKLELVKALEDASDRSEKRARRIS